ncbi:HEPN domain-containing protein [Thermodesulfobacteriota bacterium]
MRLSIKSKDDFETLMEEVDLALQAKGVPMPAREIPAIGEVAKKLNISLKVAPLSSGPIQNLYEGDSLSAHILQWFDHRYGERLKVDFSIGYSVIIIRGESWLLKCPLMYGSVTVVCDRNLKNVYQNFVTNRPGKPQQEAKFNLLHSIEKIPEGLVNRLTDEELKEILNYYMNAHNFFNAIHGSCGGDELVLGAVTDFKTSARFAVGNPTSYGQSLWSTLQAAEKILKYYIKVKGEKFPHIHNLSKLAKQSYKLGLPVINEDLLKVVQCEASVRYEQLSYTVERVVKAHQGALQIALIVIKALYPTATS